MKTKQLSYEDVPYGWAVCFQDDCPMHDRCLRHLAGTCVPATVITHNTVLRTARREEDCQMFAVAEPVMLARGLKGLFGNVERWQKQTLRHQVISAFSSRTEYYRYYNGEKPLSPAQQEIVALIFRQNGITTPPRFDEQYEMFYFPKKGNR